MLGGIAFQLGASPCASLLHPISADRACDVLPLTAAVSIYMILAAEFLLRYRFDKPLHTKGGVLPKSFQFDNGVKLMIIGLAFDGVFILIRYVPVARSARCPPPPRGSDI